MATVNNLELEFGTLPLTHSEDMTIPITVRGNIEFTAAEVRAGTQYRLGIDLMPSDQGESSNPLFPFIPLEQPIHSFNFRRRIGTGSFPFFITTSSLIITAQEDVYEFEITNSVRYADLDEDPGTVEEIRTRTERGHVLEWIFTFTEADEVYARAHLSVHPDGVTVTEPLTVPGSRRQAAPRRLA